MKKAGILLVLLLATAAAVQGQTDWKTGNYADTIVITSLPYSCPQNNTVYLLSGNLVSNDGALSVSGRSYIKIDGRGDTATFDADGSGNVFGMYIGGNAHHVSVTNLTVTQARTAGEYGSPGGSDATGLQLGQAEWLYFGDCNIHVGGHSSKCVEAGMEGYKQAVEFHGGNYTSFVRSFNSRHQSDAAAMSLGSPHPDPDTFHYYVHEIRIDSACHAGLLVGGIAWVDSNFVRIDTYNDAGSSWANAHAIADNGRAWAGSHFNYNTVRTGSNHYGGRGMYFNFAAGTADAPVEMAYNDIRVHQGYTTESDAARGLRVRWGCFYLRIHHNYIEVVCDDDPNTPHIGSSAHGIWFGAIGEEGSELGAHNWFYNNEIHAYYYGDPANVPGMATCFIADNVRDPNQPFGNDNKTFNNHFYSNFRCLQFAEDYHPASEWVSINDTLEWVDPQYRDPWGFSGVVGVGAGPVEALDNQLIDPVFINCSVNDVTNRSGGGSKSVWVRRSVDVTVTGSQNGDPIPGAAITCWDNTGTVGDPSSACGTTVTNSRGIADDTMSYHYYRWDGTSTVADQDFNNFTIRAEWAGKVAETTLTLDDIQAGEEWGSIPISLQLDTLGQQVTNVAPTTPTVNAPANGATVGSTQPLLVVNNSLDGDGDDLTYQFEVYDESGTTLITSGTVAEGVSSTTSWTVNVDLNGSTQYRWRVRAYDGLDYSGWMSLAVFTTPTAADNTAPSAPLMHTPQYGAVLNTATPTLSVRNASDADFDVLTYDFQVFDETGATLVASASNVNEGATYTTWVVSPALDDFTAYRWRARANDGLASSNWTEQRAFSVDLGLPVGLPVHSSPIAGDTVVGTPIVLIVDNAPHDGAATVTYDFHIYSDADLTQEVDQRLGVSETTGKTAATMSFSPEDGSSYWWRVQATDGSYTTDYTEASPFTFIALGSGDKGPLTASFPPDGSTIEVLRPQLSAWNVAEPNPVDYYFEVSNSSGFETLIDVSGPVAQESGDVTTWQVSNNLEPARTYYWRFRADGYQYSTAYSFSVEPTIFAYPNPVHFIQGEHVTFQLPDEPVDLLIQSVSGETVRIQEGVSNAWEWDGRNASGNLVSVGVYLWYAGGSSQSGKIVVKP